MKIAVKNDPIPWIMFLLCLASGVISHLMIFAATPQKSLRVYQSLSLGLGYDVMNAAMLTVFAMLISMILWGTYKRTVYTGIFFLFLVCLFIDSNYVQQFGTHFPFSGVEYLTELDNLGSSIWTTLWGRNFWLILALPFVVFCVLLKIIRVKRERSAASKIMAQVVTFLLLILTGGVGGAYSNSYVSKNMNDPLTSSPLTYFYWSRRISAIDPIQEPTESLGIISKTVRGEISHNLKYKGLPLVRERLAESCRNFEKRTPLAASICNDKQPNILFIVLESFRASEIGAYGSKIKITPHFDRWTKKGIFFENFYANGFQTRHGEVATYCSMMPNYGVPMMKRYLHNTIHCLPEQLKDRGYQTSWVHGADAAFDGQLQFMGKIGFSKVLDKFSYPLDTETLGWGYSDKALFNKWIEVLDQEKEPFFSSVLTITNHHPFDVPEGYRIFNSKDDTHKYYESMFYTDAVLNDFLSAIQKKSWYRNSLIFILADTANFQQPQTEYRDFEDFVRIRSQIPLLILGGQVKKAFVEKRYFSQIDLAPTVMDLLGSRYTVPWAGVSMMSSESTGVAFTNRPGNYWVVMSQQGRYYNEADRKDHYFGFSDPGLKVTYKKLGHAWLQLTKWMLQEDLFWRH